MNNNSFLHEISWFKSYVKHENGQIKDLYASLPPLEIMQESEVIQEGTGAMRAYQEMMYGVSSQDAGLRKKWEQLLRQYCKLDTLAMVIIWEYWKRKLTV